MCRQNHLTLKVLQTLLGDLIIFMEQKLKQNKFGSTEADVINKFYCSIDLLS